MPATRTTPPLIKFNAGELSPRLRGRTDLQQYYDGCSRLEHMVVLPHGAATRRPGTQFVERALDPEGLPGRLIPFVFSDDDAYVLEFCQDQIRVFRDGALVLDDVTGWPYTIASPYTSAQLKGIQYCQSADVLFLAHPDHPPHTLSRYGHANWVLEPITFVDGPYDDENSTADLTLTASDLTGQVSLFATSDLFAPQWVGRMIRINESSASKWTVWFQGNTINEVPAWRWYDGNVYVSINAGTTGDRPPIHTSGTESDGGISWEYMYSGFGYGTITQVTSPTEVVVDVASRLPFSALAGEMRWQLGAWHQGNYPRAVTIFHERLMWGGSRIEPERLWMSAVGDYYTHSPGSEAADAINVNLAGRQVSEVRWLASTTHLIIGTSSGLWRVSTPSGEALTPSNGSYTQDVSFGATLLGPVPVAQSLLYVQRLGHKLRETAYDISNDGLIAVDRTILSEHLTATCTIADMAWQEEPHGILWCLRDDGSLIGLTHQADQKVYGWHRHPMQVAEQPPEILE